ncbi:MAG: hypothetical protein GKR96_11055 [Gammaproteobacteria bacterium]|nr:hypothetical protein [Gammaproteobacteria bacterium]
MTGTLKNTQVTMNNGSAKRISKQRGTLFFCHSKCYGHFIEAQKSSKARGRLVTFDQEVSGCTDDFPVLKSNGFDSFQGKQ